jgi:hypothetical protein
VTLLESRDDFSSALKSKCLVMKNGEYLNPETLVEAAQRLIDRGRL